ncbi:hypothetical protein F511_09533 [Dorcoceras hygrometricum]|uniref:Uncharacterized protein n=1 Tax=Dorcoceras hygrometricum TaxID=472368 RepID=A0A2Z7CSL9_9LAMI|nr:hypothetical protein F511_09533 [Dorcoceras hygrometricum]
MRKHKGITFLGHTEAHDTISADYGQRARHYLALRVRTSHYIRPLFSPDTFAPPQ